MMVRFCLLLLLVITLLAPCAHSQPTTSTDNACVNEKNMGWRYYFVQSTNKLFIYNDGVAASQWIDSNTKVSNLGPGPVELAERGKAASRVCLDYITLAGACFHKHVDFVGVDFPLDLEHDPRRVKEALLWTKLEENDEAYVLDNMVGIPDDKAPLGGYNGIGVGQTRSKAFLEKTLASYRAHKGGEKIFAILDSDNFHHGSASLVYLAFEPYFARKDVARVLVHFDFHADIDSQGDQYFEKIKNEKTEIGCHTWQNFMFIQDQGWAEKVVTDIVWIGGNNAGRWPSIRVNGEVVHAEMPKISIFKQNDLNLKQKEKRPIQLLEGKNTEEWMTSWFKTKGEGKKVVVYLTFDRDFLDYACTPWNNAESTGVGGGSYTRMQGITDGMHALIRACYANRATCEIVGADFTGFPAGSTSSKYSKFECVKNAMEDLAFLVHGLYQDEKMRKVEENQPLQFAKLSNIEKDTSLDNALLALTGDREATRSYTPTKRIEKMKLKKLQMQKQKESQLSSKVEVVEVTYRHLDLKLGTCDGKPCKAGLGPISSHTSTQLCCGNPNSEEKFVCSPAFAAKKKVGSNFACD